jgi:hypothetical protein
MCQYSWVVMRLLISYSLGLGTTEVVFAGKNRQGSGHRHAVIKIRFITVGKSSRYMFWFEGY